MNQARRVLEELKEKHIPPDTVLGGRLRDRAGLVKTLRQRARFMGTLLLCAYGAQVVLVGVIAGVLFLWKPLVASPKELGYVSAPLLLGLLEFSRKMTPEYITLRLALDAAPHATDEQLANLICSLLTALVPAQGKDPSASAARRAST